MIYRKLPGHRRGLLRGASLWIAPDHILSIKSLRFREEYKRFYLRDIQAVVVADAPRVHLSTRALSVAVLWAAVYFATRYREPWIPAVLWSAAVLLVGSWLYVSFARSCTCRIYTAVSRDDLPSIYRGWTARKFLAEVEPLIGQVQGSVPVEGTESVEELRVGPIAAPSVLPSPFSPDAPPATARRHTPASDIFVASLLATAALDILTLHAMTRTVESIWYCLGFLVVASAIGIFLQYRNGTLRSGMHLLAIVTLISMGGLYYVRQILASLAFRPQPIVLDPNAFSALPSYLLIRQVEAGLSLLLGLAGIVLILRPNREPAP
jgi:hypothetical protein